MLGPDRLFFVGVGRLAAPGQDVRPLDQRFDIVLQIANGAGHAVELCLYRFRTRSGPNSLPAFGFPTFPIHLGRLEHTMCH